MPTKTLTFNFKKKTIFKIDKNDYQTKALAKKDILGIQTFSFSGGGISYHLIPVKITKNDLKINRVKKDVEIDGMFKVKVNVSSKHMNAFQNCLKNKSFEVRSMGFNTNDVLGLEILQFVFPKPEKTKELIDIS